MCTIRLHRNQSRGGLCGGRYSSEERMLAAWLAHVEQRDPDAFYLYQVPLSPCPSLCLLLHV